MKTLKGFENWTQVKAATAPDGSQMAVFEREDYRITVSEADYMPGGLNINVRPIDRNSYTPDIYIEAQFGENIRLVSQSIQIQTTSWGSLDISEIDKVVEAYTKAQTVAHEIIKAFPQCFKIN